MTETLRPNLWHFTCSCLLRKRGKSCFPNLSDWSPISSAQKDLLERPFSNNEILRVVNDLGTNRTPESDGWQLNSSTNHGILLKTEVREWSMIFSLFSFLLDATINANLNETYICLISKKVDAKSVGDYQPFSLTVSSHSYGSLLELYVDGGRTKGVYQGHFCGKRHMLYSLRILNLWITLFSFLHTKIFFSTIFSTPSFHPFIFLIESWFFIKENKNLFNTTKEFGEASGLSQNSWGSILKMIMSLIWHQNMAAKWVIGRRHTGHPFTL